MESETMPSTEPTPAPEPPPEVPAEPPPEAPDMAKVRAYYAALQIDLARRASEIELFLGFIVGTEALGTRMAKIENFLGIKAV